VRWLKRSRVDVTTRLTSRVSGVGVINVFLVVRCVMRALGGLHLGHVPGLVVDRLKRSFAVSWISHIFTYHSKAARPDTSFVLSAHASRIGRDTRVRRASDLSFVTFGRRRTLCCCGLSGAVCMLCPRPGLF
jgi:hypothetical protein